MRDIGARIQRYRLSRYGRVGGATFRWAWPLLFLWLVYATLLGDHSLFRIWRMGTETGRVQSELVATREELDRLEHRLHDRGAQREMGERVLRERSGFAKPGEIIYRIPPADSVAK